MKSLPESFGRYQVQRELGRGAMGIVYLAHDTELDRKVAIKMISLVGEAQERDMQEGRFRQEARAAGGLSHPSIITVYDVGREGDMAYIAMEQVEGRELRDMIVDGSLAPSQAMEIAALVADALDFAHSRGVVHRDIKPGNIMVMADGRLKVMDFGIARMQQATVKTRSGVLLGSPQYMSPEQVTGGEIDGRADIFSLGVVLYEMLTGLKPFDAPDLTQVLFAVVNMPAKPPGERRPGLPPVVDYIIARALKKRAEERYATAAEFAADLRRSRGEVLEAESAMRERAAAGDTLPAHATELPAADERVELRVAPRFASAEALAKLSVMPGDDDTRSRAGWTVEVPKPRIRTGGMAAVLIATYGVALLLAIAIVVF
ncbi:MAG: serine/threonine-protein kinase [Usitatibacter sp.]